MIVHNWKKYKWTAEENCTSLFGKELSVDKVCVWELWETKNITWINRITGLVPNELGKIMRVYVWTVDQIIIWKWRLMFKKEMCFLNIDSTVHQMRRNWKTLKNTK